MKKKIIIFSFFILFLFIFSLLPVTIINVVSYCSYSNFLTNVSPSDNSIVSGINVSYVTIESHFLDGLADNINISLNADNGLFYINDTTNVINGTYSLNIMLANFSSETYYTYYVNITNGACHLSYSYTFQTVYMGGYPEFQILSYKLNNIFENMIKEGDEMDINLSIETGIFFIIILLSLWLFFVSRYLEKRKDVALALTQFLLMIPLSIVLGVICFTFIFGYVLVFIIPVISIWIIADSLFKKRSK